MEGMVGVSTSIVLQEAFALEGIPLPRFLRGEFQPPVREDKAFGWDHMTLLDLFSAFCVAIASVI